MPDNIYPSDAWLQETIAAHGRNAIGKILQAEEKQLAEISEGGLADVFAYLGHLGTLTGLTMIKEMVRFIKDNAAAEPDNAMFAQMLAQVEDFENRQGIKREAFDAGAKANKELRDHESPQAIPGKIIDIITGKEIG